MLVFLIFAQVRFIIKRNFEEGAMELTSKMRYVNEKVGEQRRLPANGAPDAYNLNGPRTLDSTDSSYDTSYINQHFNRAYMDGDYSFVSITGSLKSCHS